MASKRIVSIQVCRGLAAFLVVLAHLDNIEKKYCPTHIMRFFQHGVLGVDMFFVISGIVISIVTVGKFQSTRNSLTFLYHRFARIYPIYWVYTSVVLAAFLYNPMWINANSGHKANILASYLLVPNPLGFLVMQGWTLSFEIYFYLVFFVLLMLVPERTAGWVLALWGATVVGLKLYLGTVAGPLVAVLTNPLVLEFLAGCLIFRIYRHARLHRIAGIILIALAIFWLAGIIVYNTAYSGGDVSHIEAGLWLRPVLYGTFSFLFLLGAIELERSGLIRYFRFLESVGNWSYSIYLSHLILLELIGRSVHRFAAGGQDSILWIGAIGVPAVLFAGYLSYVCVEIPLMALLYRSRTRPAVAAS